MRAILTYHSIDDSGSPISVSPAQFRAHADWLASGAVEVLPLARLVAAPPASDAVALTFDDGFVNLRDTAWPLLRERGLRATLFVPTSRAGRDNAWGDRDAPGIPTLPLLGWDDLRALAHQGLELGSHGHAHRDLRALSDAELQDDLDLAASIVEREAGLRPESFAYPYGFHDARVEKAVARRHALACTTELRLLRAGEPPHALPRLDAYYFREAGRLEAWGTPRFAVYLALRAGLRRLRGLAAGLNGGRGGHG